MVCVNRAAEDTKNSRPLLFSFLLLPGFSLISFSSAVEPIHKVNRLLGKTVYSPVLISVDGRAVSSSSGVNVHVDGNLGKVTRSDILFICGSSDSSVRDDDNEVAVSWLQKSPDIPAAIGGIGNGSDILARAGLLDGCRAASSGQVPTTATRYPNVMFTRNLYELDNRRYTSSSGSAPMDMMLALIGKQQGLDLTATVAEILGQGRHGRYGKGKATIKADSVKIGPEPKLREALDLMLSNIEEPLGADELASHVGISRRQLERLFRKNLNTAPSKYYLQLRLEEARKLLRDDNIPVVQVALATGFSNASHFSTAYRNHFQVTPREERQRSRDNGINELKHSLPVSVSVSVSTG